jgi:hypothetical protein
MSKISRRDVVKLAAGVAVGGTAAAVAAPREGSGEVKENDTPGEPAIDEMLKMALRNPESFMFTEKVTFVVDGAQRWRELYITSARDVERKPTQMRVPTSSMRIFRADAARDEFTQQGGVYWKLLRGEEEKIQFKQPGALIMIVRDDDAVRCYTLEPDTRC